MRKKMKKVLLVTSVLLALLFAVLFFKPEETQVVVSMKIEDDGWYWTQVHLPSGGELLAETSVSEYWDRFNNKMERRFGVKIGKIFLGKYCGCMETQDSKYVFLPAYYHGIETLIFFAEDGSIWLIEVPEEIKTPQIGEMKLEAKVYR